MDPAACLPAEVQAVIPEVRKLLANALVGFMICTAIYGISILQTYLYFKTFKKDRWWLKLTVASLMTLDTASTVLVAHAAFHDLITNFGDWAANSNIPLSFAIEAGVVTITVFIAQCFYMVQIWLVSKSKLYVAIIFLPAIVTAVMGMATMVYLIKEPSYNSLTAKEYKAILIVFQVLAAFADTAIAVAMCYYLHTSRSGLKRTEMLVNNLILYGISRGVVTALVQILYMITFIAIPLEFIWIPFHQLLGKLYVNSVLMTLNIRTALRRRQDAVEGAGTSIQLSNMLFESGFTDDTPSSGMRTDESTLAMSTGHGHLHHQQLAQRADVTVTSARTKREKEESGVADEEKGRSSIELNKLPL